MRREKPAERKFCRNCERAGIRVEVKQFETENGLEWLHVEQGVAGLPYKVCTTYTVAEPPETVGEWAGKLLSPPKKREGQ